MWIWYDMIHTHVGIYELFSKVILLGRLFLRHILITCPRALSTQICWSLLRGETNQASNTIALHSAYLQWLGIESSEVGVTLFSVPTQGFGVNLYVKRPTAKYVAKSYNYRIAKLWNSLPMTLQQRHCQLLSPNSQSI